MNPIASILQIYPLMILDGALATELERRGCDLDDPLWSARVLIESPQAIKQVHLDYFAAGADCAITATYQATFEGFARRGISHEDAAGLMRLAVRLAVEARDEFWSQSANRQERPRPLVAASVGPYGAFLADGSEYSGEYGTSDEDLRAFHRPRMAVLAGSGADLLACETIPSLQEALVLADLLTEFPQCTAWMSFSARGGGLTCHGESLADCAARLDGCEGVAAIGVNCTAPHNVDDAVRTIRSATDKPILAYPNSGERFAPGGLGWSGPGELDRFGEEAKQWYEEGTRLIGGCCRTTPAQIRAISQWSRGN